MLDVCHTYRNRLPVNGCSPAKFFPPIHLFLRFLLFSTIQTIFPLLMHIILYSRDLHFVCHTGSIPEHLMTAQTQTGLCLQWLLRANARCKEELEPIWNQLLHLLYVPEHFHTPYCVSGGLEVLRNIKERFSSLNEGTLSCCLQWGKMTAPEAPAYGTL